MLLLLVMIPFLTSFLIRAYAWFIILRQNGVLNSILEASRIIPTIFPHRIELLYTPVAVVIALVYAYLPFMICQSMAAWRNSMSRCSKQQLIWEQGRLERAGA